MKGKIAIEALSGYAPYSGYVIRIQETNDESLILFSSEATSSGCL
jgi:hypothetical protein